MTREATHATGRSAPVAALQLAAAVCLLAWATPGCVSLGTHVQTEARSWGAFTEVLGGDLALGQSMLPAPVREGYCYRVVIATEEAEGRPQLSFQGQIDRDSVGFDIQPLDRRSTPSGADHVTVFGFCSQGSGTVQLVAQMPSAGYGALLEAPFGSLGPSHGDDVVQAQAWLAQRTARLGARRDRQAREREQAAVEQLVESVRGDLSARLDELVNGHGRYRDTVLDESHGNVPLEENLILEPGRCYLFAAVGHGATSLEVDVAFSRIRNAAERSDVGGGVMYAVCTAPSGPMQEVRFTVAATVPTGSPHPPIYAVRVAHRTESSAERRAADAEWRGNDPEASAP